MTDSFVEIACGEQGCQAVVVFHTDVLAKLRRTHETWYCPQGHPRYFPGKTKQEKRIEELEGSVKRYSRWLEEAEADARDLLTCPWSWCPRAGYPYANRDNWIRHLQRHHGLPEQVDPREEAEAS